LFADPISRLHLEHHGSAATTAVSDRRLQPDCRLPPYLFARINKTKYEKRVAGIDIIDLGMGNPTDPTPESVVAKLQEAALDSAQSPLQREQRHHRPAP